MSRAFRRGSIVLATLLQVLAPASLRDAGSGSAHLSDAGGLRFEPNLGQTHDRAAFVARSRGYAVSLTPQEALFRFRSAGRAGMTFLGANPRASLAGSEPLAGRSHYFRGRDQEQWIPNVPNYRRVIGRDLYRGIDVVYYGQGNRLAFDLI